VYTRKSTEEGLQSDFSSLDAQRESAEAYIKSQSNEGWICLPDRYDDAGFTGANTARPGLKRLLADIEAGRVDVIVVYKVDRLSRSLLDFARMMEIFDKHRVSFVAVSQQFTTTHSMGRLTLNILLSFAQFERELISERTRDKMAASRRKGKYVGGQAVLGFDVDRQAKRLIVNPEEADQIRTIFRLYLEHQSLLPVVKELDRRVWRNKRWRTRKGVENGGRPFTKNAVHTILTNVSYVGKVRYKDEIFDGEQPAIIDVDVWQRVQAILERNGRSGGGEVRNKFGALLRGILRCSPCNSSMVASHTTRGGNRRYRYYTCRNAQRRGWHVCPSKSVPAGEIERHVVEQIRCIGRDPALLRETLAKATEKAAEDQAVLQAELRVLHRDDELWNAEVHGVLDEVAKGGNPAALQRLAELQERIRCMEARTSEINDQLSALDAGRVTEDDITTALAAFDPVWNALSPREQARIVQLFVERVDYDGAASTITIRFHLCGIKALAAEHRRAQLEQPA
jgi:site-specific DNA recombinase